jgi:hypothetical protein
LRAVDNRWKPNIHALKHCDSSALAYLALRLPFGAGAWLAFIAFTLAVSLAQDARSEARHRQTVGATLAPAE